MKELVKRFKETTGYKSTDIARKFNVSKQFIDQTLNNHSLTYSNSNKYMLTTMIDTKIKEVKNKIAELEQLKEDIKNYNAKN